ncbi:hypothetical protein ABUW04_33295 [Streptacidiphilus sp. N1-10]|uniref:DUF4269 domain-containing protein n=1 Tax=Streptacidiphilus jeojiensis TaxID=3229225 RepID=A0ABV6XXX6_9ACTN
MTACQNWGISQAHPMGSSGLGTALPASDIDLYAPIPSHYPDLPALHAALRGHATYQKTRTVPTGRPRHLFTFSQDGTKVDLNLVQPPDHQLAVTVLREIASTLTLEDRIAHTWIKYLLHDRDAAGYDDWKEALRMRGSVTLRRLRRVQTAGAPRP